MEKLLNVRQAAALLNVSQMTIRRWTNDGLLTCFRIGKKRERRFSEADLHAFLAGRTDPVAGATAAPAPNRPAGRTDGVSLGFANLHIPDGTHLTHLYLDRSEALGIQGFFVRQGLNTGETVMVVAPADQRDTLLDTLARDGIPVQDLIQQDRLIHGTGKQTPEQMIALIARISSSAQSGFRLVGDMSWTTVAGWSLEQTKALEESTNTRLAPGLLFLCQYSLTEFSGAQTMMALETHGFSIYKNKLIRLHF
ncbi:MEDS domain-containing protein [Desulfotignum balticum]|uniref:MEDS domain-containing protein n=1 Tax=Desulfotignum balticum TaxID=115781 RepID=UPI00040E4F35|nr:MEDS domain-containing protein [Desulfotignum balticum]